MMVTLLVTVLSQLLPEEDDNDTETSRRAPVRKKPYLALAENTHDQYGPISPE